MKTKMIIKPLKLKKMGNNENGRVDAMELILKIITETAEIAKENKIKIVLICVLEDKKNKGIASVKAGMSKERAFMELSSAIADEFAETIQEEI